MKTLLAVTAGVVLLAGPALCQSTNRAKALPRNVASLRDKYVNMVAKLEGEHTNRRVALRAEYVDALLKLGSELKTKGADEKTLYELRKERERFARARNWVLEKRDRLSAAAKPVFNVYRERWEATAAKHQAARKRLDDYYGSHLQKVKQDLTQQNRIPEALAVKAAQDEIAGFEPPDKGRPYLAEGREPCAIATKAELAEYLTGTWWKLRWRAGSLPKRHKETLTFHLGQMMRMADDDGKVEKCGYEIRDDLSVRTLSRREKTLVFDPSFTTFDYADPYYKRYRRGILEASPEAETAGNMWEDLLLFYPLDEVSETVRDAGPHGHHGKAEMTAVVFYGRKQNAYLFNGRSSRIRTDNAIHPDSLSALSISLWINVPRDIRDATVFCWPETEPSGKTYLYIYRGRFRCRFGSGSNDTMVELKQTYEPGKWHHVVMTHERVGGNVVYLDGKPIHSHPALPLKGSATHFYIGCRGTPEDDRPFRGLIDEFMVFKRALSPTEVNALFRCDRPPVKSTAAGTKPSE
jgi:hypothetical protein